MMIGHNLGFHEFAFALASDGPPGLLRDLAASYPTCALAGIEFGAAYWADVRPGAGRLACFVRPRALR